MVSIAPVDTDNPSHVVWAGFVDECPTFATAEGEVIFVEGKQSITKPHDGLVCAAVFPDGKTLLTGGEDGKVCLNTIQGLTIINEASSRWIDHVSVGPQGVIAFASGKQITVVQDGNSRQIEAERSVEGLAFAPKGLRLAVARYNGVDLHWVNNSAPPQFLEWNGAHTGVGFSPDGKFLVTTMQENALHGWTLPVAKNMRMSGYPAKVKSMSFSPKGKWLATSGAPSAIVWPFTGKDGPMGKAPKELGTMGEVLVTQVACHPLEQIVAIGYQNGMILVVKIDDGKEVPLRRGGDSAITTLGWDRRGDRLSFGSESGEMGIITLVEQ